MLGGSPDMQSFLDESLSVIVEETLSPYSTGELNTKIKPENDLQIAYTVQQNKNAFEFLQQLAAKNGEFLFYNCDTLYFGKPDMGDEIELRYGYDLKDFSLGMSAQPMNFNYFSREYAGDDTVSALSSDVSTGASGYSAYATKRSNGLFDNTTRINFNGFEDDKTQSRMDHAMSLQKKALEQKQVLLEGESTNTSLSLGKVVKIKTMSGEYFGSYRIAEIEHSYERRGKYKNRFKAIPMEIDIYPKTDVNSKVAATPEVATVLDTDDPDGMSRVQVQFPWQERISQNTPWVRVTSPYAGSDRGFHFIPEKGDTVIVGFDHGDAERPYVQGALYTGSSKASQWQSQNNDFKGITTKGGHTIELNDTKGAEMITITDPSGNAITIDTAAGDIQINAMENLSINAKNITISAGETLSLSSGKATTHSIGEQYSLMAQSMNLVSEKEVMISCQKKQEVASEEITLSSNTKNLTLSSGKMVDIQSTEKVKLY